MTSVRQISKVVTVTTSNEYQRIRIRIPKGATVGAIKVHARPINQKMKSGAIYYGTANGTFNGSTINQAFIDALTKSSENTKSKVLTMNASASEKAFYVRPVSWGFADLSIETSQGTIKGGFLAPVVFTVTDDTTGAQEDYYCYESINTNIVGTIYIL